MYLTIKDILQLLHNKSVTLAAGAASVENTVFSTNIMDAPDVLNWVKEGDLILTTAYIMKDNAALQERIIEDLVTVGAAGLGIKTKRFLMDIPPIIIETAEKLNFPILNLPADLSLAEVMNPIVSSIADKQSYILRRTIDIQKTINRIAIQGNGLQSIINCLGALTQFPVVCYDNNGVPLVYCLPEKIPGVPDTLLDEFNTFISKKHANNGKLLDLLVKTKAPYTQDIFIQKQPCYATSLPVIANDEVFGHITIIQTSKTFWEINSIALQQTCIVAALEFAKQKAVAQAYRLQTRNLLEALLIDDSSKSELSELLVDSRIKNAHFFECWVIHIDESENADTPTVLSRLYKTAQQFLMSEKPFSIISEHAGKIIVLAASMKKFADDQHLSITLHKLFKDTYKNIKISIGIGTVVTDIMSTSKSYHTACSCLRFGLKLKGIDKITFPYEIACYSILYQNEASDLLTQIYGPIIEKLNEESPMLLYTLSTFLEYDQRMTETAGALYIHRNTLTNRLEKIASLINLDFSNKEAIFCLRLALRQQHYDKKPLN